MFNSKHCPFWLRGLLFAHLLVCLLVFLEQDTRFGALCKYSGCIDKFHAVGCMEVPPPCPDDLELENFMLVFDKSGKSLGMRECSEVMRESAGLQHQSQGQDTGTDADAKEFWNCVDRCDKDRGDMKSIWEMMQSTAFRYPEEWARPAKELGALEDVIQLVVAGWEGQ